MIEIVDNLVQFLVALCCCILSGALYLKSRMRCEHKASQAYFLLCCFYGCFGLGVLYWLLYMVLTSESPAVFYVSDIGWISGYLFLLLLQGNLAEDGERALRSRVPWLAVAVMVPLTAYYAYIGDVLYNLIIGTLMTVMLMHAIRGLIWQREQSQPSRSKRLFHVAVIGFVVLENCLWLSGYPWAGDTLANPYFWFDFAVTVAVFALLPATRGAVRA